MGYRKARTLYKLKFVDEEGLEVRAAGVDTRTFLDVSLLVDKQDSESTRALFEAFARSLHDWNLETEDGTPVPATLEGVLDQEPDFAMQMVHAWLDALAGVSADLKAPSSSGTPSVVASLPMDVSSPNRPSSSGPGL